MQIRLNPDDLDYRPGLDAMQDRLAILRDVDTARRVDGDARERSPVGVLGKLARIDDERPVDVLYVDKAGQDRARVYYVA